MEIDKPIVWLHGEIKSPPFSRQARIEAGVLLRQLQRGEVLGMPHSRPLPGVGKACHELRVRDEFRNWRVVYFVDDDAIVILEVFHKTTRSTPKSVIDVSKQRLRKYQADIH